MKSNFIVNTSGEAPTTRKCSNNFSSDNDETFIFVGLLIESKEEIEIESIISKYEYYWTQLKFK